MTQQAVADDVTALLGKSFSKSMVTKVEGGTRDLSFEEGVALSRVLGIEVENLVEDVLSIKTPAPIRRVRLSLVRAIKSLEQAHHHVQDWHAKTVVVRRSLESVQQKQQSEAMLYDFLAVEGPKATRAIRLLEEMVEYFTVCLERLDMAASEVKGDS